MLTKPQKEEIVAELTELFKRQKIAFFTDFQGISVTKLQSLRRLLKKENAEFKVAKKTLFDRALEQAGITFKSKELKGELGVAFGYGDQVAPAKTLVKFGKQEETFKLLAGILAGKVLTDKQIIALAKLPSREVLLAQLAATLQAPMRGLAVVLQANIRGLAIALNKVREQKA